LSTKYSLSGQKLAFDVSEHPSSLEPAHKHSKPTPVIDAARHTSRGNSERDSHYERGAPLINAPVPSWRSADLR